MGGPSLVPLVVYVNPSFHPMEHDGLSGDPLPAVWRVPQANLPDSEASLREKVAADVVEIYTPATLAYTSRSLAGAVRTNKCLCVVGKVVDVGAPVYRRNGHGVFGAGRRVVLVTLASPAERQETAFLLVRS